MSLSRFNALKQNAFHLSTMFKVYPVLFLLIAGLVWSYPAHPSAQSYQFAAIGDFGSHHKSEKKVAQLIHQYEPTFIITLGDNNYPNGCWSSIDRNIGKYYHDFIHPYVGRYGKGAEENRFYPSLGNHDWHARKVCLENGTLPYLIYFQLPDHQRYYYFQKPYIDFFVLDSDRHEPDGRQIDSIQYQWFVKKIKASKATFKIVYFHQPPYSSGQHGPTKAMRWPFKQLGADLVLSGHEHNYERIEKQGLPYIINGLSGPPSRRKKGETIEPDSVFFYSKGYGFLLFDVSADTLSIKFINTHNEIIDERIIEKRSSSL